MASRALLTFARRGARAYATARPVFPTTTPKRGAATSVTQAEIDAELLGGAPAPRATPAAAPSTSGASSSPAAPAETGLGEAVEGAPPGDGATDWSRSYHGLSVTPFPKESADVLLAPVDPRDVEIKPGSLPLLSTFCAPTHACDTDGLIYLPEIKYRRVLNRAFGPGGWGLAPRSETNVGPRIVSREYALVCLGRLVAIARGEQEYFDPSGIPTATEAAKSNALMRCCKDLGIASELWDPRFIREFKAQHGAEVFAEHLPTKKKWVGRGTRVVLVADAVCRKKLWRRKDQPKFDYPWKE
jgi:hypothetical protein